MTQPADLPDFLQPFFVCEGSPYTHVCTWDEFLWRFNVPANKQRQFWRHVKESVHCFDMHQVSDQSSNVEAWAKAHIKQTGDRHDRLSAADAAYLFQHDTGCSISARALGDTLKHVLVWQRLKSNGVMVYTCIKYT
jgi:hypothetical protein